MYWLPRRFRRRMVRSPPALLRVLVLGLAVLAYGTTGFLYFELPSNPRTASSISG